MNDRDPELIGILPVREVSVIHRLYRFILFVSYFFVIIISDFS